MYQYLQIYYSAISTWTQALRELHLDVWEPANRVWEPGTSVWEPESRVWELASRVWELKRDVWELSSHQLPLNLTPADKCSAVVEMGNRLATIDMTENCGLCPFFWGGAGSLSNTVWREPRSTFVPSGILIHPSVWPQQTWAENGGVLCPFGEGELVPI